MPLRRLVKHMGHRKWFARIGRALVPLDKAVTRLTGGRVVALNLLPSLTLVTTGRKSGLERRQPLAYVPDGEDIILIGSNWGGPQHPGWSYNLLAQPTAQVLLKGRRFPVTAHLLSGAERQQTWQLALTVWPAYDTYAKRATPREIRVFRLTRDQTAVTPISAPIT